ncbi:hypothetical protein DH2020_049416 [Rehmannia glutinosa]|uniref:K Homology domain-containing protein n=1 Tax=Rehmannia glutinosa TaxID=99300 RepID=A0ABR0U3R6_REHGL
MADESLYSSVGGESNKRKYDDSPSPAAARRTTGFSSPPDSAVPPPAYNNVPPPMNEIELAKQKAQEIAARLLNNADPLKRARVENGGGGGGGYDSSDYSFLGIPKPMGLGLSGPPQVASSGYPGPSKKIEIPNGRVGVIIGKGGETIKYLQLQSGAKIQVTRDMDADPNSTTRGVDLMGTPDQIAKAEQLINDVLSEAEAGGSGVVSRRLTGQPSGAEQFVMKIANNKVGLVIGKGGETIKNMQARTGARIQVIPLHLPPGDMSKERTVQIDGTSEQIEAARQLVEEVTSEISFATTFKMNLDGGVQPLLLLFPWEGQLFDFCWDCLGLEGIVFCDNMGSFSVDFPFLNRVRNPSMSGGYPQQGYQARPQNNWTQPGPPMQQPGYGYTQPGAYPGQSTQYSQPPYSGYPPQPTSGGYATGWDQSTAPQNQQAAQGGSYDYYNQQQQPTQQQQAPTDGSGYNYNQAQAYGQTQGYAQDGYGGYNAQSGYSQPQSNPNAGYDQQQQGYNSNYGNVSNPTPDGQTPSYAAQGEANQAPPPGQAYSAGNQSQPPNYPPQASTQPGYGVPAGYGPPQPQKPAGGQAVYAQPQQSPSAQGGGGGGYAQPPSSYPASQPGYGAPPPYGAPPAYGAYNSSYGGGYSQPPAYPSSDVTPPPQSAQPGGAAKASPPS